MKNKLNKIIQTLFVAGLILSGQIVSAYEDSCVKVNGAAEDMNDGKAPDAATQSIPTGSPSIFDSVRIKFTQSDNMEFEPSPRGNYSLFSLIESVLAESQAQKDGLSFNVAYQGGFQLQLNFTGWEI